MEQFVREFWGDDDPDWKNRLADMDIAEERMRRIRERLHGLHKAKGGKKGDAKGLDNAAPMLALARERAAASNVHFIEGELDTLVGSWDLIVLNMVLHHMPSPAAAINSCAALLRAGGTLLLADLCTHQQT